MWAKYKILIPFIFLLIGYSQCSYGYKIGIECDGKSYFIDLARLNNLCDVFKKFIPKYDIKKPVKVVIGNDIVFAIVNNQNSIANFMRECKELPVSWQLRVHYTDQLQNMNNIRKLAQVIMTMTATKEFLVNNYGYKPSIAVIFVLPSNYIVKKSSFKNLLEKITDTECIKRVGKDYYTSQKCPFRLVIEYRNSYFSIFECDDLLNTPVFIKNGKIIDVISEASLVENDIVVQEKFIEIYGWIIENLERDLRSNEIPLPPRETLAVSSASAVSSSSGQSQTSSVTTSGSASSSSNVPASSNASSSLITISSTVSSSSSQSQASSVTSSGSASSSATSSSTGTTSSSSDLQQAEEGPAPFGSMNDDQNYNSNVQLLAQPGMGETYEREAHEVNSREETKNRIKKDREKERPRIVVGIDKSGGYIFYNPRADLEADLLKETLAKLGETPMMPEGVQNEPPGIETLIQKKEKLNSSFTDYMDVRDFGVAI